jgi:hypothetical protein
MSRNANGNPLKSISLSPKEMKKFLKYVGPFLGPEFFTSTDDEVTYKSFETMGQKFSENMIIDWNGFHPIRRTKLQISM